MAAATHDVRPVNKENSLPLGRREMMKNMEEAKRGETNNAPYSVKPQT
jgi:hypothetical protein